MDIRIGSESQWNKFLKKRQRTEKEYFFFSVRMMSYGFGSVFLTVFFLLKLSKKMLPYDMILSLFYLVTLLSVFALVFMDVNRFNRR